jgi:hypothetical protein
MDSIHGEWRSIIHKGWSDVQRNVAIFNYPGSTRITVVSGLGNHNNWNWHFVSNRALPLHKWTHVAFAHGDFGAKLWINKDLDSHHGLSGYPARIPEGPLYISDPWYVQDAGGKTFLC